MRQSSSAVCSTAQDQRLADEAKEEVRLERIPESAASWSSRAYIEEQRVLGSEQSRSVVQREPGLKQGRS